MLVLTNHHNVLRLLNLAKQNRKGNCYSFLTQIAFLVTRAPAATGYATRAFGLYVASPIASLYKYLQECAILRTKDFEAIKLCLFEIGDIYRNFRSLA